MFYPQRPKWTPDLPIRSIPRTSNINWCAGAGGDGGEIVILPLQLFSFQAIVYGFLFFQLCLNFNFEYQN